MVTTKTSSRKALHQINRSLAAALDRRRQDVVERWMERIFAARSASQAYTPEVWGHGLKDWLNQFLPLLARYLTATRSERVRRQSKEAMLQMYRQVGWDRAARGVTPDPYLSLGSLLGVEVIWQTLLPELGLDETTYGVLVAGDHVSRLMIELLMASAVAYIDYQMEQVKKKQETVAQVTNDLIDAEDKERRKIALDIHDGPAQTLVNLYNGIQLCERLAEMDLGRAKEELANLKQMAREAIREIRATISDLRTPDIGQFGLMASLSTYLENFEGLTHIRCELRAGAMRLQLASVYQALLFKVVKEALTNVRKHANATRVEVRIDDDGDHISVGVVDDGIGFDVDSAVTDSRKGRTLGLMSMQERVESLGGQLSIGSESGRGTELVIRVPKGEES